MGSTSLTVIITTYNESKDLLDTIESVRANTNCDYEVVVVDDGSNDNDGELIAASPNVSVIRHLERIGVGASREEGTRCATGEVLAFIDGHQRFTQGCLDQCWVISLDHNAIVTPDVCGFEIGDRLLHGAFFVRKTQSPPFSSEWRFVTPRQRITSISSLRAPAYVIPRDVYPKVRWSRLLRGWGGSEACVSLKAFFTKTPILHLHGPISYHKFKTKFHYEVTWDEIWRNHALIARICFSEATWYDYWLPDVFHEHLSEATRQEMDSDAVKAEHLEFQQIKVRPDHEFWTRLAFQKLPPAVNQ